MFCSNCGKEIKDDSKFCQHCGQQLVTIDKRMITNEIESTKSFLGEPTKKVVAKETSILFRIVGISAVIMFVSIFIIGYLNKDNDEYLAYGVDRDALHKRNMIRAIKENAPKVFLYSLIILTIGRYTLKSFLWAESKNKNSDIEVDGK
jgi:hypothetical protein